MATTYISTADIDYVLGGFVNRYYGTNIDGSDNTQIIGQFYTDMHRSFDETNERLAAITHIKTLPFGTQSDGSYPLNVRKLQAYALIYQRLLSAHYGEFGDNIPGWINVYRNRAEEIEADIRAQRVVFTDDIFQGEVGIGAGTWVGTKVGVANLFTNWEVGHYDFDAYPKYYHVQIDGTTLGNGIGSATFKWSDNNGQTYETTGIKTGTQWIGLEHGLEIRWENVGTANQCGYGDTLSIMCVPQTYTPKGGGIRHVTFRRG